MKNSPWKKFSIVFGEFLPTIIRGAAADIPQWELEEMVRDVIEQTMRRDIADCALLWLEQRIQAFNRLHGTLQ